MEEEAEWKKNEISQVQQQKINHKELLNDTTIRRWYSNNKKGSKVRADVYLRSLSRFSFSYVKMSPSDFAKLPIDEMENIAVDFVDAIENGNEHRPLGPPRAAMPGFHQGPADRRGRHHIGTCLGGRAKENHPERKPEERPANELTSIGAAPIDRQANEHRRGPGQGAEQRKRLLRKRLAVDNEKLVDRAQPLAHDLGAVAQVMPPALILHDDHRWPLRRERKQQSGRQRQHEPAGELPRKQPDEDHPQGQRISLDERGPGDPERRAVPFAFARRRH